MEDFKILAANSPLPEEILADILLRLPVKSLLKFRCVSKSWCCLISSKRFAKSHLQSSSITPHERTLSILPFCTNWCYTFNYCSVSSLFNSHQQSDGFDVFDYPVNKVDYRTRVVGCCNGLCCVLVDGKDFVLWNPSTRKHRKLPEVYDRYLWVDIEGFGYDQGSEDYKILAVLMVSWFGAFRSVFRLYSLKANSWKTVDFMGDAPFKGQGVFVSGKLHWVRRDVVYRGIALNINSFDLGSEEVGVVEQPSIAEGYGLYPALGVLDGCLCVLCDNSDFGTEVWVMKEYGVKESWCKVMSVPYCGRPVDHSHITLSLLYVAPDGQVLLKQGSSLFTYDPRKNSFRLLKIKTSTGLHGIGFCVESLISPFPDGGRLVQN